MRRWTIVTLFPDMFKSLSDFGISGRALNSGICELSCVNPRDYATDKHRTVDDKPYGGGPGMVMSYPPLAAAIGDARKKLAAGTECSAAVQPTKVVYLSPQGKRLDQSMANRLAEEENLILLCGRYEGIDERVIEDFVDEEISVGDYVVSGGELPAMLLLDAMIRMLPGALGDENSASQDSFAGEGLLDYPHYTRPEQVAGVDSVKTVPDILLSGDHGAIAQWRKEQAIQRTEDRRPDILRSKREG